ncbi:MAG: hypothetical protein ACKO8Q_05585 [Bacteroidota bacterium]
MNKLIVISFLLVMCSSVMAQKHSDYGSVKVLSAVTQNTFGYNAGYYVEFKNNSTKEVDGLRWQAKFYDNFGELKGTRDGQWQSGNIIDPIEVGGTGEDLEGVWVEGATKVYITIKLVHYTDGTSVKR